MTRMAGEQRKMTVTAPRDISGTRIKVISEYDGSDNLTDVRKWGWF